MRVRIRKLVSYLINSPAYITGIIGALICIIISVVESSTVGHIQSAPVHDFTLVRASSGLTVNQLYAPRTHGSVIIGHIVDTHSGLLTVSTLEQHLTQIQITPHTHVIGKKHYHRGDYLVAIIDNTQENREVVKIFFSSSPQGIPEISKTR